MAVWDTARRGMLRDGLGALGGARACCSLGGARAARCTQHGRHFGCHAVVLASDAGRWHFGTLRGGGRCAAGWGHWVGFGLAAFRLAGSLILLVFACAAGRWHFGTLRAAARQATLRCG